MSKNPARNYAIEWVQGKVVTEADALAIAVAAVIAGPPDTGDPIGDVVDTDLPLIEHLPTEATDDTLVLAPDGLGGVEFRVETGGGADFVLPGGSPVTLYVNVSTGDDTTGTGAVGLPYASIGRALEDVPTIIDRTYTIDVADGTYREQVNIDRFVFLTYLDGVTDARIILDGNTTTPANCIISGADAGAPTTPVRTMCIWVRNNARVLIQGFKLMYAVVRGLQVDYYSTVTLGAMTYDNCGGGFLAGLHSLVLLAGNQTISSVAIGIYLVEFSRLNTDSGSRSITMTGITKRGLYVVESTILLNAGDVLSITAAGSGTREAGIEGDGVSTSDLPVTVTVSGAFVYGVVAGGGAHIHLASASLTVSGYSTAAYFAADLSSVWDTTTSTYLAGGASGAPSTVNYLVGTADAGLSAEIVVGTSPGGELGGTWASPTVDATHSGSTHSAATDTHIADTSAAHAASAVSFTPNGSIAATDVQAAIQEVRDEAGTGSVATDAIWDAAGDLAVGTGANTAARLAAVATGSSLISAGTGTAPAWGHPTNSTQVVTAAADQTIGSSDTLTDATSMSVTCAAGTWIFFAYASFQCAAAGGYAALVIAKSDNTQLAQHFARAGATSAYHVGLACFTAPQVLGGSTTYKMRVQMSGTTGKVLCNPLGSTADATRLLALRVA